MEIRDILPVVGVAIGWFLSELSHYLRKRRDKFKNLGRAIATLYFIYIEMVQIKMAHENFKNISKDVKEWEGYRKRSFDKYANKDPAFATKIEDAIGYVAEYYPMEAYRLRETLNKYEFIKKKSLDKFTGNENLYIKMLSMYEVGFLGYQYILEKILLKLAFNHSINEWIKMRVDIRRMKKTMPEEEPVFGSKVLRRKKKHNN